MSHALILTGESRSFPDGDAFLQSDDTSTILVIAGEGAGAAYTALTDRSAYDLILIELGTECLGTHTGESRGEEGSKTLGFARFRLGQLAPSNLVEIVRQPASDPDAIRLARELFERHGLATAVCRDFPGRIVDRLVRPYYNAALNRLDGQLATASDMDLTLRLGLGYPKGPIELLEESGLAEHYTVTKALFDALGDRAFYPARRAQIAAARSEKA